MNLPSSPPLEGGWDERKQSEPWTFKFQLISGLYVCVVYPVKGGQFIEIMLMHGLMPCISLQGIRALNVVIFHGTGSPMKKLRKYP